jgi:hypothetical protein
MNLKNWFWWHFTKELPAGHMPAHKPRSRSRRIKDTLLVLWSYLIFDYTGQFYNGRGESSDNDIPDGWGVGLNGRFFKSWYSWHPEGPRWRKQKLRR